MIRNKSRERIGSHDFSKCLQRSQILIYRQNSWENTVKHKYLSIGMPKVKKKSDKERQRLDRIRKRTERAIETEVNASVSENQNRGDRENGVDWQDRNESDRIR